MKTRNEISKEVQTRLARNERKETIYAELKEKFVASAVERSLAQWPYPENREKYKHFNFTLLIIASFFAAITALQLIGLHSSMSATQLAGGALILLIQIYIIYGLKNFNLISYLLVILFGVRTLVFTIHSLVEAGSTASITANVMMLLALSVAAIILALVQKTRLFPHVSLFMRHKKDTDGTPIF